MRIFLLIIILIFYNKILQSKDLFSTSFYDIEFESSNIENEKIKKIAEIKTKSFTDILHRTLEDDEFNNMSTFLSEDFINTFIQNIIINDEKIINNKYVSKIKINYDKEKIVNFFRNKKIPYVEYYPNNFLLIIYEEDEINQNLFTNNNNFFSYFKKNKHKNKNNFKIPNLDLNDRYILSINDIKNIDIKKIKKFSEKYNINETTIVIAKIKDNKAVYDLILVSDNQVFQKKLEFSDYLLAEFFITLEKETINIWKKINQIQNTNLNTITCEIKYYNLLELKEIRNNLNNTSIIKNFNIRSLSNKNIEYDIYYYGDFKILNNILEINKKKINQIKNSCSIRLI